MRAGPLLGLVGVLVVAGCASRTAAPPPPTPPAGGPRVSVVASFYPLSEFTRRIGREAVAVRTLVPSGAEPHGYEPTARDLAALSTARLLVYNGAGFEPWVERVLPALPASVGRVNASAGLPLVGRGPGGLDPHIWLDPLLALQQVDNIRTGLAMVDPGRRAAYETNAAALKADLEALHRRFDERLARCEGRTFITAHGAFGYLARRYNLTMIAIAGLSPEIDPSPARLKEVVDIARRHGIRTIYYETLVSPRVAQTIAREVRATTRVLNPLEGLTDNERRRGADYFTVMHENLRQLADGLGCR